MSKDTIRDNEGDEFDFDRTTSAIAVQTDLHYMSHQGLAFEVSHIFTGVLAGSDTDLVFEVPAGVQLSCDIEAASDQSLTIQFKKLATLTPNGANSLTPLNLLVGSPNSPQCTFSHTPTAMGAETQAMGPRFFPSTGTGTTRSLLGALQEIHFLEGFYSLRVTNEGSVAAKINPALYFYEETPEE